MKFKQELIYTKLIPGYSLKKIEEDYTEVNRAFEEYKKRVLKNQLKD